MNPRGEQGAPKDPHWVEIRIPSPADLWVWFMRWWRQAPPDDLERRYRRKPPCC